MFRLSASTRSLSILIHKVIQLKFKFERAPPAIKLVWVHDHKYKNKHNYYYLLLKIYIKHSMEIYLRKLTFIKFRMNSIFYNWKQKKVYLATSLRYLGGQPFYEVNAYPLVIGLIHQHFYIIIAPQSYNFLKTNILYKFACNLENKI